MLVITNIPEPAIYFAYDRDKPGWCNNELMYVPRGDVPISYLWGTDCNTKIYSAPTRFWFSATPMVTSAEVNLYILKRKRAPCIMDIVAKIMRNSYLENDTKRRECAKV